MFHKDMNHKETCKGHITKDLKGFIGSLVLNVYIFVLTVYMYLFFRIIIQA